MGEEYRFGEDGLEEMSAVFWGRWGVGMKWA